MNKKNHAVCHFCAKKVEYTDCSDREPSPGDARCNIMRGWLTVSHWQGMHAVDYYDFCSFGCLHKWVNAQFPRVPSVFLKALGNE
ncbi:MAG: hypothetical protein NTZ04_05455 [Chloroflexi bacterium]|nr:hypothetical protein [Chloroflexota bacterium]